MPEIPNNLPMPKRPYVGRLIAKPNALKVLGKFNTEWALVMYHAEVPLVHAKAYFDELIRSQYQTPAECSLDSIPESSIRDMFTRARASTSAIEGYLAAYREKRAQANLASA